MASTLLSPNRMFVPLDPGELNRLRGDDGLAEIYIDTLSLIQDLLCRHVEEHGRPQFPDPVEVTKALDEVVESGRHAVADNPSNRPIAEGLRENAARAKVLSADALGDSVYPIQQVKEEISRFLDSVLEQYIRVTRR